MTENQAINWCAKQKTIVQFQPAHTTMGLTNSACSSDLVLITAHCGTRLCYGSGSTFTEAVEACDADLTKVLEARERAKAAQP